MFTELKVLASPSLNYNPVLCKIYRNIYGGIYVGDMATMTNETPDTSDIRDIGDHGVSVAGARPYIETQCPEQKHKRAA